MSASCVRKIVELSCIQRPFDDRPDITWEKVEADLGISLAPDVKCLVSEIGPGFFGSGFHLLNPYVESGRLFMSKHVLVDFKKTVEFMTRQMGVKLYPDKDGLVLVGFWDRQCFFVENLKPDYISKKVVWIDFDSEEIQEFYMSFSCFIYKLYQGDLGQEKAIELREAVWRMGSTNFFVPQF